MPPGGWPKTMAMLLAKDAPDVFRVDDDSVYYLAMGGLALHLDPYIKQHMKKGDYYPLLFESLAVEGKNYCLNPCMGANVLYYNADLFREAGITNVSKDWRQAVDWNTWVDWLGRLAKKRGADVDVYAMSYPMNMITAMVHSNDAPPFNADETRCLMDSTPALEIVQAWVDLSLKNQYVAPPTASRTQLFNQKKLAVMWESMSIVPGIAKDVDWDVMPMPKGKKKAITENYVRSFIVPSFTKVPEQAFLTLKHFLDKEGQEIISRYDWGVPFLKSVAEGPVFLDAARPPKTRKIWSQTLEPGWDAPLPLNPASYWFKQIFTDRHMGFGLQDVLEGKVTAREFLEEGARQVNRHLQEMAWKKGKRVTAEEWKP
jgi:multiple sugar transport system substrate-binding protein